LGNQVIELLNLSCLSGLLGLSGLFSLSGLLGSFSVEV
jgi:hypothetical protein